jgi:hypothetical protein
VNCTTGEAVLYVSGKTATVKGDKSTRREFSLGKAPKAHFCDCVIASYAGAHHKVAVLSCGTVYGNGKQFFYWNEMKSSTMRGVRIFEDVRDPLQEMSKCQQN